MVTGDNAGGRERAGGPDRQRIAGIDLDGIAIGIRLGPAGGGDDLQRAWPRGCNPFPVSAARERSQREHEAGKTYGLHDLPQIGYEENALLPTWSLGPYNTSP